MSSEVTFQQNIDSLFSDIHNLVNSETVLGSPVSAGGKTLIPVMAVTVGYGSTGMGTKMETTDTKHSSNGIGLGARISTSAVVVIDDQGVSMLPVSEKSNMGQMMEKIPQAIASLGQSMTGQQSGQQGQQGQQASQQQSQQSQSTSGQQSSSSSPTSNMNSTNKNSSSFQ